MGDAGALIVYAVVLVVAAGAVWRRPVVALYAFAVGLVAHNAVMAALYAAGVRGSALTAIAAWKEILLATALACAGTRAWSERRLPFRPNAVDALALAFAALVVLYAILPQGTLGGAAGSKAVAYALRDELAPVGAYLLGRSLPLDRDALRRLAWTLLGAGAVTAGVGLVEEYAVSLAWWRSAHVPAYFRDQLGFTYHGPGGLPENFVFNTGNENALHRRLVSFFLSPLGSAYMLMVTLLLAAGAVRRRLRLAGALAAVAFAGLLWTFSRSALAALAAGLVVLALGARRTVPLVPAAAVVGIAIGFAAAFPSIAPTAHFFQDDLAYQHEQAKLHGGVPPGTLNPAEPSLRSHLNSLRDGLRTVVTHPQGFGLGNSGSTAARNGVPLKAGESAYTQLGVDTGLAGMALFALWCLALLAGLVRSARRQRDPAIAGVAGAFAAVLAIALQTDVLGIPWLSYVVWLVAGAQLLPAAARDRAASRSPSPTPPKEATVP